MPQSVNVEQLRTVDDNQTINPTKKYIIELNISGTFEQVAAEKSLFEKSDQLAESILKNTVLDLDLDKLPAGIYSYTLVTGAKTDQQWSTENGSGTAVPQGFIAKNVDFNHVYTIKDWGKNYAAHLETATPANIKTEYLRTYSGESYEKIPTKGGSGIPGIKVPPWVKVTGMVGAVGFLLRSLNN